MILNTSLTLCMEIVFPGGRRQWAQPIRVRRPRRACGAMVNNSTGVRSMRYSTYWAAPTAADPKKSYVKR